MRKQIAALATDEQHMVMWDIDAVLNDIVCLPDISVATSKLTPKEWVSIDKKYAMTTDYSVPIVLFELPHKKAYIADGNHRLYRAVTEGVQQMRVVLLPEKTHLKYLYRCSVEDYFEVIRGLMKENIFIDAPL